jgi:hypothetical protein
VSNTDDPEIVWEVRIATIRTDGRLDVDNLAVEIGQHLLEVHARQVDRVATVGAEFPEDVRICVGGESADEPAAVVVDTS